MSDTAVGQALPTDSYSAYNATSFMIKQIVARINTATLVQIKSVTNSGGVSPVGSVDVLPLVNQVDGAGNPTEHVTVYGLPYVRIQGGTNAVIIDPKVGDIGIAVFAAGAALALLASTGAFTGRLVLTPDLAALMTLAASAALIWWSFLPVERPIATVFE